MKRNVEYLFDLRVENDFLMSQSTKDLFFFFGGVGRGGDKFCLHCDPSLQGHSLKIKYQIQFFTSYKVAHTSIIIVVCGSFHKSFNLNSIKFSYLLLLNLSYLEIDILGAHQYFLSNEGSCRIRKIVRCFFGAL